MMTAKRFTNRDARDGITINIRSVSSFLNVSIDELTTKEDYLPEHRDELLNLNVAKCAEGPCTP
jgi:hypothetical protein